jgi:hypothetical protein
MKTAARNVVTLTVVAAGVALLACGISDAEYARIVDDAAVCSPGEACVLAGGSDCTCPQPVNARNAARVNAAADDVRCGNIMVKCRGFGEPRCANGRCEAEDGR